MNRRYQNSFIPHNPRIISHLAKLSYYGLQQERWRNVDQSLIRDHHNQHSAIQSLGPYSPDQKIIDHHALVSVLGHATTSLRFAGLHILLDPVWSKRVGPLNLFGPKRHIPMLKIDELAKPDYILISHDHYDHLDLKSLKYLCDKYAPKIITGIGVGSIIRRSIPQAEVIELQWWDSINFGDMTVTFVPSQHFSGRGLFFNTTLWGGFIVQIQDKVFYYVGDSGYQDKIFDEIHERFPKIDLGLIPIGSYHPYKVLKHFHLSPADAIRLKKRLDIAKAVAVHFGTFQMSLESGAKQVRDFIEHILRHPDQKDSFLLPNFSEDYLLELTT